MLDRLVRSNKLRFRLTLRRLFNAPSPLFFGWNNSNFFSFVVCWPDASGRSQRRQALCHPFRLRTIWLRMAAPTLPMPRPPVLLSVIRSVRPLWGGSILGYVLVRLRVLQLSLNRLPLTRWRNFPDRLTGAYTA